MADGGYDIVPRTINFIVFAAILYYFIANPIKNAYKGRIAGIAARLDNIEQKLKDSKAKKDDALRRVEEAKANAAGLVETARKEAVLISERIKEETRQEVANLEKSFQDQKEFEKRRMVKSVVGEILNEIKGDFGIFDKICFLVDGLLLGKERYTSKLVCLDTASGERLKPAWLQGECAEADNLCISADGLRLALINYDKARVIDLKSGNLRLSFELSHVVKRCEAKFERINGEEFLAVRTDYGCFSLYKI